MRLTIRNAYPAEWPLVSYAVKVAAGWRCIRCGHPDPPDFTPRGEHPCDDRCAHSGRWKRTFGKSHIAAVPHAVGRRWVWEYEAKRRVLTVHHLDGHKANLCWWNLLALCQVCHLQIQAKVDPRRPYLWEHKDWFKPYAAGFYAYWHGGLEVGRDETEARLDEFLRLGQPWLVSA